MRKITKGNTYTVSLLHYFHLDGAWKWIETEGSCPNAGQQLYPYLPFLGIDIIYKLIIGFFSNTVLYASFLC